MAVSSAEVPRAAATSASVLPVSGFSASERKPSSSTFSGPPASCIELVSPGGGFFISAITRARLAGSFMRAVHCSMPPSCTHSGIEASSPVDEAA